MAIGSRGRFALAVQVLLLLASCGAPPEFGPASQPKNQVRGEVEGGTGGYATGSCDVEGESRSCTVDLGTHGTVVTCIEGTQVCSEGVWSDCRQATMAHRQLRKRAFPEIAAVLGREVTLADIYDEQGQPQYPHLLSVDAGAVGCMSPCSPSCHEFNETPSGVVGTPTGGPPYHGGSLGGLSNGLVKKAWTASSCGSARDCQFGYYCSDPVTASLGASCAHDKCAQGAALTAACETADVCAGMICAVRPSCCSSAWDATCVQDVHDVCGAFCNAAGGSCTHDKCYAGAALVSTCDACVSTICAAHPGCCGSGGGTWTSTCVGYVATMCTGAQQCPSPRGTCNAWSPGQTDPSCKGVDLYLGVPCSSGSSVPVCNAGTQPTSGQLRIAGFAANSSSMPSMPPSCGGGGCFKHECITSQVIPPGQCVDVPCSPALGNNEELYVNPPATPYGTAVPQMPECDYGNNWSINSNTQSCSGANCQPKNGTVLATRGDIVIEVDRSGAVSSATWAGIKSGIEAFVNEAASQNNAPMMNVALAVYPDDGYSNACETTGGPACTANGCNHTVLGYTTLSTGAATVSSTIGGVAKSTLTAPSSAALGGAYLVATNDYNAASASSKPDPMVVLVMASDPDPCGTSVAAMASQASQAYAANGTRTFVIAVGLTNTTAAQTIASAGQGKGYSYGTSNVATNVQAALDDIRSNVLPCSVGLPPIAVWNVSNPSVAYTLQGSQTKHSVSQVASLAACSSTAGGFYYDNAAAPTQIILCPATCTAASAPGSTTYTTLDCTATYGPTTIPTQPYTAGSACPRGTRAQWDYLGYSTVTPLTTSVSFAVQTGLTSTSLLPAVPQVVATAHSVPTDTEYCPLGALPANSGTCPVDIFHALNGTNANGPAQNPYLDLVITLSPLSLTSPTVNSFQLTYSCPDAT